MGDICSPLRLSVLRAPSAASSDRGRKLNQRLLCGRTGSSAGVVLGSWYGCAEVIVGCTVIKI